MAVPLARDAMPFSETGPSVTVFLAASNDVPVISSVTGSPARMVIDRGVTPATTGTAVDTAVPSDPVDPADLAVPR